MSYAALIAHLGRLGVDTHITHNPGTMAGQILSGQLRRAMAHRDDVRQALWLARAPSDFQKDAEAWRIEHRWRIRSAAEKRLHMAIFGAGIGLVGALVGFGLFSAKNLTAYVPEA